MLRPFETPARAGAPRQAFGQKFEQSFGPKFGQRQASHKDSTRSGRPQYDHNARNMVFVEQDGCACDFDSRFFSVPALQ